MNNIKLKKRLVETNCSPQILQYYNFRKIVEKKNIPGHIPMCTHWSCTVTLVVYGQ